MKTEDRSKRAARRAKDRIKPKPERERGPVTLYVNSELYAEFKRECEKLESSASPVFEEMMREFLASK